MADALDLKSGILLDIRVRLPSRVFWESRIIEDVTNSLRLKYNVASLGNIGKLSQRVLQKYTLYHFCNI